MEESHIANVGRFVGAGGVKFDMMPEAATRL